MKEEITEEGKEEKNGNVGALRGGNCQELISIELK